jgi:hypothetical protein
MGEAPMCVYIKFIKYICISNIYIPKHILYLIYIYIYIDMIYCNVCMYVYLYIHKLLVRVCELYLKTPFMPDSETF